jgi:hypothetical protein
MAGWSGGVILVSWTCTEVVKCVVAKLFWDRLARPIVGFHVDGSPCVDYEFSFRLLLWT